MISLFRFPREQSLSRRLISCCSVRVQAPRSAAACWISWTTFWEASQAASISEVDGKEEGSSDLFPSPVGERFVLGAGGGLKCSRLQGYTGRVWAHPRALG